MATYYRWRKRRVTFTETTNTISDEVEVEDTTQWLTSSNAPRTTDGHYSFSIYTPKAVTNDGDSFTVSSGEYFAPRINPITVYYEATTKCGVLNSNSSIFLTYFSAFQAKKHTLVTEYGSASYVYSTSSTAYPNGGVSGNYYYDQRTTVTSPTAPTGLTYPNPITTPTVTVSWQAATSNVPNYPVSQYDVWVSLNNLPVAAIQKQVSGTGTEVSIPATYNGSPVTTVQISVRAIDTNGQYGEFQLGQSVPVYFSPTLTVPSQVMQGQQATINWSAIEGADSYTLQRKANTDSDWVQVYSGGNTTFSETVGTWTNVQYRVQAVFDGTGGGWAESVSIPVISASALVISGSDGDLGTLVNDVQYTINTDTGNQITAKVTVNSAVVFSGNVTSGAASTISIFDLVNGTGTIVIEASVQASSGVVNATRTWTYTKAELTFPDTGSIAQLLQKGKNIFPKTLAECIRTSDIWGGDLSSALQKLVNAVICDPETGSLGSMSGSSPTIPMFEFGSYRGTGSYSSAHMNTLTFSFKPLVLFVFPELPYNSDGGLDAWWFIALNGMTLSQSAHYARGEPDTYFVNLTWNGNSVSWYSNGNAKDQLNSTETYYYAAIGLPGGDE